MLIQGGTIRSGRFRTCSVVGLVLDQLHHSILVDDLAGGDRQVLADLELGRVGLPNFEVTAAALDVFGEELHAPHQVLTIGRESLVEQLRVREHPVRWRNRIDDLRHIEPGLVPGVGIETFGRIDQGFGPVRGDQVRLSQQVEVGVF